MASLKRGKYMGEQETQGMMVYGSPIGFGAISWIGDQIDALELPCKSAVLAYSRLRVRVGDRPSLNPPPYIAEIALRIAKHLSGAPDPFRDLHIPSKGSSPFAKNVYAALRDVPPGKTITYGALAASIGKPGAAQAVGRAVGANPIPLLIPCHRVLPASGGYGGFSAQEGVALKEKLLQIEGVVLNAAHRRGK
jgi:methylated-DNA-[protein]-cysteine S-methyltransferase